MDVKMSAHLTGMLRNTQAARPLYQDLLVKQHAAAEKMQVVKGRQVLFMINAFFSTNKHNDFVYTVTDLVKLPWLGGREVGQLRSKWDSTVGSIKDKLDEETLADLLASKMERSQELRDDMARYSRLSVDDKEHTYQYLRGTIDRCLLRRQQKKNREEQSRAFSNPAGDRGRESHDRSANPAQKLASQRRQKRRAWKEQTAEPRAW